MSRRVLHLLLTHQRAAAVAAMVAWWEETGVTREDILLVATHPDEREFAAMDVPRKLAVHDARLRTRDHQRERQSYVGVFAAIARWLRDHAAGGQEFAALHLAEYDHLPLAPDLADRFLGALRTERADVLGHELRRVDGTNQPHYLYHLGDGRFASFWAGMSRRRDADGRAAVLSMFGSGTVWTPAAFMAVAGLPEPCPVYLELWLPTAAHHLGFRVREFPPEAGGARFISSLGERQGQIAEARAAGAWTLHPVKRLWEERAAAETTPAAARRP